MIEVIFKHTFTRAFKPLRKRYPNIHKDIATLIAILRENPTYGIDMGDGLYKIKMLITDKKQAKTVVQGLLPAWSRMMLQPKM